MSRSDLRVAHLARAQHGCVTRSQALEAGWSRSTILRRVRAGLLIPAGSRTYRLGSAPPDLRSQAMAASLDRGGPVAVRTALWLAGLWPSPTEIEVLVVKGRSVATSPMSPGLLPIRVHATTSLPAADVVEVDGIRSTGVARSLLGLAALVPGEVSAATLLETTASAIESGAATLAWLRWTLEERRCRGRDGVVALERALDARDRVGPTDSWLERRTLAMLAAVGLPRPRVQQRIRRATGAPARVDFLFEEVRVVLEVLGYAFHRTPEQIAADTLRANDLQLEGFVVLQVTARSLEREGDRVLAQIAAALGRPAPSRIGSVPAA